MPFKALVGDSQVNGGDIIGPGALRVKVLGFPVAIVGDKVAPHAPFTGKHLAATIISGDPKVRAQGKPVARIGDLCSCGHQIQTGSYDVNLDSAGPPLNSTTMSALFSSGGALGSGFGADAYLAKYGVAVH